MKFLLKRLNLIQLKWLDFPMVIVRLRRVTGEMACIAPDVRMYGLNLANCTTILVGTSQTFLLYIYIYIYFVVLTSSWSNFWVFPRQKSPGFHPAQVQSLGSSPSLFARNGPMPSAVVLPLVGVAGWNFWTNQ